MSDTQSYKSVTYPEGEQIAVAMAILDKTHDLKRQIASNQGYIDNIDIASGGDDELRRKYRESSENYGAGLRNELANLESFYRKLMGFRL